MIQELAHSQAALVADRCSAVRKDLGQYFTPPEVASYMAEQLRLPEKPDSAPIRVLDAGAGAGMLSVAVAWRLCELGVKAVHVDAFEIDEFVVPLLDENYKAAAKALRERGCRFTYELLEEDFVLSRPDQNGRRYDIASINPPYFKYNSHSSPYANATADLYVGNPNIYASFMAITCASLKPEGQMVAIVPRSFANGLYFKGFRKYLTAEYSLERFHVFRSRKDVFRESKVLQENVICKVVRRKQSPEIEVRTSQGCADLSKSTVSRIAAHTLIDGVSGHNIIRLPESESALEALRTAEEWPSTFESLGYTVSTGPVVVHRARGHISAGLQKGAVPLLKMHNVRRFSVQWGGVHPKDSSIFVDEVSTKIVSANLRYVLLKRFSSKDEKRRLTAGVYEPSMVESQFIGLENHINVIGRRDAEITGEEAHGIAVLFNSSLVDEYFRCVSGNTQVNATEIRLMKLPSREVIRCIGSAFLAERNRGIHTDADELLSRFL